MPALVVVLGALAALAVTAGSSWCGGATASATTPSTSEARPTISRERREPYGIEETEAVRRRRAVQAADRLRAQLQATMQAVVEAGDDVPAEVSEATLVLERWVREIAQLPPAE
jgi:hypothetical protein